MTETQYIRAVNDYSISGHEKHARYFGKIPTVLSILSLQNISYTSIEEIINDISNILVDRKIKLKENDKISFYEDNNEGQDDYTIYKQNVVTFQINETVKDILYKKGFTLEFLGSPTTLTITILGNEDEIVTFVTEQIKIVSQKYKIQEIKEEKRVFYTITQSQHGFELEDLNIKEHNFSEIDIENNYNDDFHLAHNEIQNLILNDKKGLVLLHGIPGSGKTTYIKYLITKAYKRKIVYIPPQLASSIANPSFITFVKEQLKNCVLVIEDAEQVLRSRDDPMAHNDAVTNILNMTDGILADAFNILIIATFNAERQFLDAALFRKGRLQVEYRFDQLSAIKTKQLIKKLYDIDYTTTGMTIADIYNFNYNQIRPEEKPKVSFGFIPA